MSPQPLAHERVTVIHDVEPDSSARYVLYWMIAQRRTRSNHGLGRAADWARHLRCPLLVFEPLGLAYEHASPRMHAFVIDGMRDNAAACDAQGVRYLSYVEPTRRAGRGLLAALAAHAAVVVSDDHPVHPFPKLVAHARSQIEVRFEVVDGCGMFPIRATDKLRTTAYAFRRYLQKNLPPRLEEHPSEEPLRKVSDLPSAVVPRDILEAWPELRAEPPEDLSSLPIDQSVGPVNQRGGARAARARMRAFLEEDLPRYAEDRNHPDLGAESNLSPYLHFGHIGSHELFSALTRQEGWSVDDLDALANGRRSGWWGMSASAEAFLDQFITWRELGFHTCVHLPDTYASMDSLPDFAQKTLARHTGDQRPHLYSMEALEAAQTGDPIWNAAQRQLVLEGTIQNYLRMNWGKRILEWSETPEEALVRMIHLNDKYALDGRDPNSYSGILWCLGRNDRAWGPERPIFGSVRYMTSENTRRKLKMTRYLERFGADARLPGFDD